MSKLPDFLKVGRQRVGYRTVGVKRGEQTRKNKSEITIENKMPKAPKVLQEELCEDPKIILKHRNSLQFLSNQELGATAGVRAKKEFYQMKASYKEKTLSSNLLIPFSYDSCEVNFITGDDMSLFGVWCLSNGRRENNYIMGEMSYMNDESCAFENYKHCNAALDVCRCTAGSFITVPSNVSQSLIEELNTFVPVPTDCYPPWHCCCFLPAMDTIVLGGDVCMSFINFRDHSSHSRAYPAKVRTLSSYEPSKLFLAGLHTGDIWICDYRTLEVENSYEISDKAVNDCLFLNDQEVIVTDVEGNLVKVDLRARKISATFFGHKHSVTKRPFSVANDMLCATGSDNVIRIWHVSGGHPIHEQKPTSGHEIRGWLNTEGNKSYLTCFEKDTLSVFRI